MSDIFDDMHIVLNELNNLMIKIKIIENDLLLSNNIGL